MPPDALRIALISEHASPLAVPAGMAAGAPGVDLGPVARALAQRGHCVDVLVRRESPSQPALVELQAGVRVRHVDAGPAVRLPAAECLQHMPEFARQTTRLLDTDERHAACDVLHAQGFMSGLVGLRLARACGLPLAVSFHAPALARRELQDGADDGPPERVDIERTLVQQADALVALCPQDRADLMRLYGARPARISTVPWGVDTQHFAPGDKAQARRALGWADDEFIILQVGPLLPGTGTDDVILALARLPRTLRARLIVVAGDGAGADDSCTPGAALETARLGALARDAGVADRVSFAGRCARQQLPQCYAGADVLAATPWCEPFGTSPLEAMACGTPVIGSTVGSIRHTVAPGVSGCLVPPREPDALAAQLMRLQTHPQVLRALGRGSVQRARTLFAWDRVAAGLATVYRTLAPAARPQRRRQVAALAAMRLPAAPVAAPQASAGVLS
jgi:glycosyltransferase involved in cell wall biosynthesis